MSFSATQNNLVEAGDPLADRKAYRRCLGQFATGVTVVTAEHEGRRVGVTVNSFTSRSLTPPLVMWSISRGSRSYAVFRQARRFGVNVLTMDQVRLSQHFSGASDDKFANCDWSAEDDSSPMLSGMVAFFKCSTEALHDAGDHAIMIERVAQFARFDKEPLVFARGRYDVLHTSMSGGAA